VYNPLVEVGVGIIGGVLFIGIGFRVFADRQAPVSSKIVGGFLILLGLACFYFGIVPGCSGHAIL
jgi:hypothetical protein